MKLKRHTNFLNENQPYHSQKHIDEVGYKFTYSKMVDFFDSNVGEVEGYKFYVDKPSGQWNFYNRETDELFYIDFLFDENAVFVIDENHRIPYTRKHPFIKKENVKSENFTKLKNILIETFNFYLNEVNQETIKVMNKYDI